MIRKTIATALSTALLTTVIVVASMTSRLDPIGGLRGKLLLTRCMVMDEKGAIVQGWLMAFCAPHEDGSIAMVPLGGTSPLLYFDRTGTLLWRLEIDAHHALRWSNDGQTLITLGSEVFEYKDKQVRFDVLYRIDKKGKIVSSYRFYERREELISLMKQHKVLERRIGKVFTKPKPRAGSFFEFSHLNSFYEIPANTSYSHPLLAPGNMVINSVKLPLILILSPDFKQVLWSWTNPTQHHVLHDVQVSRNGEIIVYNNEPYGEGIEYSSLDVYSFPGMQLTKRAVANRAGEFYSDVRGGFEELENSEFLVNDAFGNLFYVDRRMHLRPLLQLPIKDIHDVQVVDLTEFFKNNLYLMR